MSTVLFSGCGNSNNGGFVFTGNQPPATKEEEPLVPVPVPPPAAPVAVNDTFVSLGNGILNQSAANGVLRNDEVNGGTVDVFQGATSSGGTINIAADGSFTYTPPANFLGTDRFEYTLANETGSSTANALIVVSNRAFFVDTAVAPGGDGSQNDPFSNLTDAFNAAEFGDTVFVFAPSSISGQINLPRGVNLIGEGTGLVVAQTIVAPGTAPTLEGPVVPDSDSVIAGFTIGGGPRGVQSLNGHNITVRGNRFQASTNEHVRIENPFGPIYIESNIFEDPSPNQDAVNIAHTGGNQTVSVTVDDNTFNSSGGSALGMGVRVLTPTSETNTYNIRRNTFTGTSTATSYQDAIFVESQAGSSNEANISENTITRMQTNGIRLLSRNGSELFGDVFNNNISECGVNNIHFRGQDGARGTMNAFGNTVADSGDDGIRLDFATGSQMRYLLSGNTISGSTDDGVFIDRLTGAFGSVLLQGNTFSNNGGDGVDGALINGDAGDHQEIAMRDNVFSGSGGEDAVFNLSLGDFTACFDIQNNTFNDNLSINQANNVVVNVERFNEGLNTLNTFVSGSPSTTGTINSVADCAVI